MTHIRRISLVGCMGGLVLVFILSLVSPAAADPPVGFRTETLILNLTQPVHLAFLPDGHMLIVERAGKIKVVPPGATQPAAQPFLQLTNINTVAERGFAVLLVDPDFANNKHFYLFYTANNPLRDRLSRFTALSSTSAEPGSEIVIWEDTVEAGEIHHGGGMVFGADGKLYLGLGDHFQALDAPRLTSYHGKLLRLNKDGSIPTDNPFYDGDGPNLDAIYARGLRNPYRMTYDAPTGRIYIGDVGGNMGTSWEEINVAAPGANFGWPTCEGGCDLSGITGPWYTYPHNGRDASMTVGALYRGTQFPLAYRGVFFYGDYAQNWLRYLTLDAPGSVIDSHPFEPVDGAYDGPYGDIVCVVEGPDGALYYCDVGIDYTDFFNPRPGAIRRISYVGGINLPPVISQAAATPTNGPGPSLAVTFTSQATDPENDNLTYLWTFGDGATSTQPNPTHTYTQRGKYTARLTVADVTQQTLSAPITVEVGQRPVVTIQSPQPNALFRAGDTIPFSATAIDPDGVLTDTHYAWTIVFLHETHVHPVAGPLIGPTGSFTVPATGHDFSQNTRYLFRLTVTDSDGLTASEGVIIFPDKVNLNFASVPSGLSIIIDGIPHETPFVYDTLIGFHHTLVAPGKQIRFGASHRFTHWSDGSPATTILTVPASPITRTATYASATLRPVTTGVFRPSSGALFLKDQHTSGVADRVLAYGIPGDKPIMGDWTGDGVDTPGIYRNGVVYLRNSNTSGIADTTFVYGAPGDIPIAGDWDGDGIDTIGIFRLGTLFLRNTNTPGPADYVYSFGAPNDVPIVGDWIGQAFDTLGLFRAASRYFFIRTTHASGIAEYAFEYGLPNDKPLAGDWDGNGASSIGVYRQGVFYLRNANTSGVSDLAYALGIDGDEPLAGDWDGLP